MGLLPRHYYASIRVPKMAAPGEVEHTLRKARFKMVNVMIFFLILLGFSDFLESPCNTRYCL